jgi:hypothetical protein
MAGVADVRARAAVGWFVCMVDMLKVSGEVVGGCECGREI